MENIINPPTKFTQEIKDKWLKALKSGEYIQGFHRLVDSTNSTYCCIGVLGDTIPGLNNTWNKECPESSPYSFLKNTIGYDLQRDLYLTNDNLDYRNTGKKYYSNVIPLIEQLPVTE